MLHTNPSNKRFIFYLKEYKIELSINLRLPIYNENMRQTNLSPIFVRFQQRCY